MINSLEQIVECKRQLDKSVKFNDDLSKHLIGSIIQILRYGEKYNVTVPKKSQLEQILFNTKELLEEHNKIAQDFNKTNDFFLKSSSRPTTLDKKNNRHRLYRTKK